MTKEEITALAKAMNACLGQQLKNGMTRNNIKASIAHLIPKDNRLEIAVPARLYTKFTVVCGMFEDEQDLVTMILE